MVKPPIDFSKYLYEEGGRLFWNTDHPPNKKVGQPAGSLDSKGYYRVGLLGTSYLSHRIIHYLNTGEWPDMVDHKDGDKVNNNPNNLRSSNVHLNSSNQKVPSNSSTKVVGVGLHKQSGKFCARVSYMGSRKFLGLFDTVGEAEVKVEEFKNKFGVGRIGND